MAKESGNSRGDSDNSHVPMSPNIIVDLSHLEPSAPQAPTKTSMRVPLQPISIKSSSGFEVSVSTSSLRAGWYWAVFQVSFKNVPDGMLDDITFDVTRTTATYISTESQEHTCTTVVTKVDIADIHHILWGEENPDQFIRIEAEHAECDERPIAIDGYDFSDGGELAATIYFIDAAASPISEAVHNQVAPFFRSSVRILNFRIDVWDLSEPSWRASADNPQAITKPLATITHSVPVLRSCPDNALNEAKALVNISSTGSQIVTAVGSMRVSKYITPFLIFRVNHRPECLAGLEYLAEQDPLTDYKQVTKTCQSLQDFFGFGSFRLSDQDDSKTERELYITFHEVQD
ncbi:hypothetical protein BGZ68_003152 [Mortierella alpina]|nr:hypothetical protein BGZ68_003152 [Mortierella alpina]